MIEVHVTVNDICFGAQKAVMILNKTLFKFFLLEESLAKCGNHSLSIEFYFDNNFDIEL